MLGAVGGPKWESLAYAVRPERGLLGLRNALLTATRGMGVMNTIVAEYGTNAGVIQVSIGSQALPT